MNTHSQRNRRQIRKSSSTLLLGNPRVTDVTSVNSNHKLFSKFSFKLVGNDGFSFKDGMCKARSGRGGTELCTSDRKKGSTMHPLGGRLVRTAGACGGGMESFHFGEGR